nr:MAG TPA: hypothetical protein [Caudoviricetes sp.]
MSLESLAIQIFSVYQMATKTPFLATRMATNGKPRIG